MYLLSFLVFKFFSAVSKRFKQCQIYIRHLLVSHSDLCLKHFVLRILFTLSILPAIHYFLFCVKSVVLQTFYICSFLFPGKIFVIILFFQTLSVCLLILALDSAMYAIERTLQLVRCSLPTLTCSLPNIDMFVTKH